MAKEKDHVMKHLGEEKSKEKSGSKLHTHALHITRADHGGHHLRHEMRDEEGNPAPDQTSVAANNEEMGEQVQGAMGDQPPAGQGQPPTAAAAPPDPSGGAAAAPMPGQ
jgi:hypothetical protein